jgi:hypothetical protein
VAHVARGPNIATPTVASSRSLGEEADVDRSELERDRWAKMYLSRLERLCSLEERYVSPPDAVAEPRRLVCKAIFAAYCTCVTLGRKDEAERLIGRRLSVGAPFESEASSQAEAAR